MVPAGPAEKRSGALRVSTHDIRAGDHLKEEAELAEERLILEEMLEVVEQRDALVSLLEEQRLQERQEERDLQAAMLSPCCRHANARFSVLLEALSLSL
ncbi:hypothetical protein LDENG_00195110 [Lucifuga dentata]|nr:hypothetical protein LDENG_00195110 [Lucifuga dentata]